MVAQVLQVEPEETIQFQGSFNEVVTTEVKLTNPTADVIAFKVKTTAPRRYAVRPNSGVLNGGEHAIVSVMRQPFDAESSEKTRHKFMIQAVKVGAGQDVATIWNDTDSSKFMETKLKVLFEDQAPGRSSTMSDQEYNKMLTDNQRLSKEVMDLQAQKNELLTKGDNVPSGLSLLFYEKKNMFLILILLAMCFAAGLFLSDMVLIPPMDDEDL